ncbi:YtxH domain-containing protein [Fluviicola sp.]|jgi:gas vesicle protein|uniref:YtxH domain-containing protein n=1 Tax=Fluviicola sp. TaxID=1917219 RepID=UPI0028387C8A|nr:YtxH domain-containing protein [Fluviicola sp.]MDR0801445.1 YtxH domain-containing protein [Fluviicola sp.]
MSNNTGNIILALLAGAVVGAGIGILMAPNEGSVTRQKIKDSVGKSKDELIDKYHELAQLLHQKAEKAGENLGEFIDKVIESGNHEKDELIALLEAKLELLKTPVKKTAKEYGV